MYGHTVKNEQCHQHIPKGVVHTGGEKQVLARMEVEAHNPMNMACKTKRLKLHAEGEIQETIFSIFKLISTRTGTYL
jgi:hypothetical protein